MKKLKVIMFLLIYLICFFEIDNNIVYATDDSDIEYTCTYKNKIGDSKLTLTKYFDKWVVKYPDYTETDIYLDDKGNNMFPTERCEDIFYSNNAKIFVAIDDKFPQYDKKIEQHCQFRRDLEQFCQDGVCKIKTENPICSTDTPESYGECPEELKPIIKFIKLVVFNTIQIFVPILLILLGSIDLAKAVMASDEKLMKDSMNRFIRRIVMAVLMFFIATIVTIFMNMFAKVPDVGAQNDWKACWFD